MWRNARKAACEREENPTTFVELTNETRLKLGYGATSRSGVDAEAKEEINSVSADGSAEAEVRLRFDRVLQTA